MLKWAMVHLIIFYQDVVQQILMSFHALVSHVEPMSQYGLQLAKSVFCKRVVRVFLNLQTVTSMKHQDLGCNANGVVCLHCFKSLNMNMCSKSRMQPVYWARLPMSYLVQTHA
jgi:hypothetical protein